jgi:RimJ/RimL family protein N-acetyltransferase
MVAGLVLREARDTDDDAVFAWTNDPTAIALAAFTRPALADRDAFVAHARRIRSDPAIRNRAVVVDDELVGTIASFPVEGDIEITYWIDRARWGQGIATAALRRFVAEVDPRRPLTARAAEANTGSIRVLERVGFHETGRAVGFAAGVGAEVVERIYVLD